MLQWFKRQANASRKAGELYGAVVTAARQPAFYRDMRVPDTPEGRFELVALHLFLALEGRKDLGTEEHELARRTIEAFVADMDDCMREMGVGDLTVPKKVKRAAAAFYERALAYRQGLDGAAPSTALEENLARYISESASGNEGIAAAALAHYVRGVATALKTAPFEVISSDGTLGRILSSSGTNTT